MSTEFTFRRCTREWLVALSSFALVVAPFGCQVQITPLDPNSNSGGQTGTDTLTTSTAGLFINEDLTSPLIAAGRSPTGDTFFIYGTHGADGNVGEVTAIRVQTIAGEQSYIKFNLGRPVRIQGADGSNLQISYDQITPTHVVAHASAYDATGALVGTQTADIDLQQTVQQVVAMVQALTGQTISVPNAADVHASAATSKTLQHGQRALLAIAMALALIAFTDALILTGGQIFDTLFTAMGVVARATLLIIFSPVFLFARLLSGAIGHVFSTPLLRVFIYLPPAP